MIDKKKGVFATLYFVLGLAVTLISPELDSVEQRVILFCIFAGVVLSIQAFRWLYRTKQEQQTNRERPVEVMLDSLIDAHEEMSNTDNTRANVMVPVENRPLLSKLTSRLSSRTLEFKDHTGGFSEDELGFSYKFKQGTCGLAWKKSRPVVYGEGQKGEPEKEMTEEQLEETDHIESILSVPVYDGKRIPENLICVVNIDSDDPLPETSFTDKRLQSEVEDVASAIAATIKEDYHA